RGAGEPPGLRARGHARVQRTEGLMPLFGELEIDAVAPALPQLRDLDTEAWQIPKAEIVQVAYEVADGTRTLLPRALHPAIPEHVTFVVARDPASPVRPFDLPQLRLIARARVHRRGRQADDADLGERVDVRHGSPAHPLRDGPADPRGERNEEGPLSQARGAGASSACRRPFRSPSGVNGFGSRMMPGSRTPWWPS